MRGSLHDVLTGLRCLWRGFGLVVRTPRLLLFGALPAAVTTLIYAAAIIGLLFVVGDMVGWATPFADSWSEGARGLLRFVLAAALVVGAVAIAVVTFAAVTLAIGGIFYDRISEHVDQMLGGASAHGDEPGAVESARDSLRLIAASLLRMVPLSALGVIPVVGQSVVPVAVALTGAWFLTVEVTGAALGGRGYDLAARRRLLGRRPLLVLGFGVPAYLGCVIPLVAILVMPVAVAGATLLAREVTGEGGSSSSGLAGPSRP